MLKELFINYQQNLNDDEAFMKLVKALEPKILSVFKTIRCGNAYRDDFIQDCHIKIFNVAKMKHFDDSATDIVLNVYFERALKTVRRDFIRDYHINDRVLIFEDKFMDKYMDSDDESIKENIFVNLKKIKTILKDKDFRFILLFIDNEKIRSMTEVSRLLNISVQVVSKRFNRIKKCIREKVKNQ